MDFTQYKVEDFVLEESFQKWVLCKDNNYKSFWEEWIALHPEKKHTVEEAYYILRSLEPDQITIKENIIDKEFDAVSEFYDHTFIQEEEKEQTPVFSLKRITKIAASFLIFILAGVSLYFYFANTNKVSEYITEAEQIQEITLPDGSRVILNQNSHLTFNEDWESNKLRKVELDGEAYFHVSHKTIGNQKIKFIVQSGDLQVEVLGTQFNVNNYNGNSTVVLNSGKVRLSTKGKILNMNPGDVIEYHAKNARLVKKNTDHKQYTSWVSSYKEGNSNTANVSHPETKNATASEGKEAQRDNRNNPATNRGLNIRSNQGAETVSATLKTDNPSAKSRSATSSDNGITATETSSPEVSSAGYTGVESQYINHSNQHENTQQRGNRSEIFQQGNKNDAYIEQIGEGLKSNQVQIGNQNQAVTKFEGKNIQTSKDEFGWATNQEQKGERNVSIFNIMNSYNSNAYSTQIGNENKVKAYVEGEENILMIYQYGQYNEINAVQEGVDNEAGVSPLDPGILQNGQFNEADILQRGKNNKLNIKQQGDQNKAIINQKEKKSF